MVGAKRIDEDLDEIVDNLSVANDDVIIIELQHKNEWVFSAEKPETLPEQLSTAVSTTSES